MSFILIILRHIITARAFILNMSTFYVQSVKTHTPSLYTNTIAYITARNMNNTNKQDNDLEQQQQEGGNFTFLLIASNAHTIDPRNTGNINIKYIYLRAVFAAHIFSYLTTRPLLEGEEDTTPREDMSEGEEEEKSVSSSSLLRSPEVRVPPQTPRAPGTPTKEDGAGVLRTPERFGTPASSSKVSEVRRDLAKNMTMTGSSARGREGRREAAEERRKEARDHQLGRDLLLPDPSPSRERLNSAPPLLNAAVPHDINQDNVAPDVSSRHPSGEGDRADPNAPEGQCFAPPAPGNHTGGQEAAATEPLVNEGNNRSLTPTPHKLAGSETVSKSDTVKDKSKKGRRSDRRGKKVKQNVTTPKGNEQGAEEPGPSGVQHPDDVFAMPSPVATLTITREGAGIDGLALVTQTLFQVPIDFNMTNPIRPIPDGAMLDVCDQTSAEAIAEELRRLGWHVVVNPIWPRYEFVAPAILAGSGPDHQGPTLDPLTIVRGLTTRNRSLGLAQDALRFVSSAWEGVRGEGEWEGQTLQRLRIWVDVSPEGEEFLRGHSFLLRTLSSAVRLRPATRNRQRPDGS